MSLFRSCKLPALLTIAAALVGPSAAQPAPPAPRPAAPKSAAPAPKPPAPSSVAQATLLGQFGDWGAYAATPEGKKICFALSKPTAMQDNPPNRRNPNMSVFMFISSRPADRVKDEVSLLIVGYKLKPNLDANLAVAGAAFPLYTQNDGAWVKVAGDDLKVVDALRKASEATVKATTAGNTQTIDTFSLKGISQALDRVAQECPAATSSR
jgi:hypothetical protein